MSIDNLSQKEIRISELKKIGIRSWLACEEIFMFEQAGLQKDATSLIKVGRNPYISNKLFFKLRVHLLLKNRQIYLNS